MMGVWHLVRRFFASVFARAPDPEEQSWVAARLTSQEFELWTRQTRYDRRHTLGVGREVEGRLGADRGDAAPWVGAALLHDIGKVDVGLGILGRVVATLARGVFGEQRLASRASKPGFVGRVGGYIEHGTRGAAMIRTVGGRELVAHWAEIHHRVASNPTDPDRIIPDRAVRVLKAADRD